VPSDTASGEFAVSSHIGLRSAAATDLIAAVAAGEFERADTFLPQLRGPQCDDAWKAAAEVHTVALRWDEAAEALTHIRHPDEPTQSRLTLSRNMAALKTHRPQTYRSVIDAGPADVYRIHTLGDKQKTIVYQPKGEPEKFYSRNPIATVTGAMRQLRPMCQQGQPLAILSIGDGHLLLSLAKNPPTLFMDKQQAIFLVEPDPRLLLVNLLVHDFTGPTGPIEQERIHWYVGEHWAKAFRVDTLTDRYLPFPVTNIKLSHEPQPLETQLQGILNDLMKADAAMADHVNAYYGPLTADDFRHAIAGDFGRPPRVMLLTTRLSTVLQYSTKDTADAFRRLGWDVQTVIEPTQHHTITKVAIRRTLCEFKPDLIFQIDHNRFEHGEVMPENVPFVNWIQDLLPHLMKRETGQKLGARDFVLTPSLQRWVDNFAYPQRQCMEFRKLSRVPDRPISWQAGEDLVYVSNWSQQPAQMRDELLSGKQDKEREVLAAACDRMIAHYAAGSTLHTVGDVRRMLQDVLEELEIAGGEALVRQTTTRLFDRMNNVLYRQQGLSWARQAATEAGLRLCIYGTGWEKHPEFAAHARGPIGYGAPLEALTRSAGINLVLEPFVCIAHQRLLDALMAGGFCLVRNTPGNAILQSLTKLLASVDPSLQDAKAVRAALRSPADIALFEQTLRACGEIDSEQDFDHFANARRQIDSGFLSTSDQLLPCLDRVLFDSPAELLHASVRFLRDPELRGEIARQQRHAVEKRYSYSAGVSRMVEFIAGRLASENVAIGKAA